MHQNQNNSYDYIIVGAGCAGLSLLMRLLDNPITQQKSILLLDKVQKNTNDRTWCFWEKNKGYFDSILTHKWHNLSFLAKGLTQLKNISPYSYKMIRGKDFYTFCFNRIKSHSNIDIVYAEVQAIENFDTHATVTTPSQTYSGKKIFSSLLLTPPQLRSRDIYLLQHFKGWVVETQTPFFDENTATFMDFRIEQIHGTSFVYVLPITPQKALVEYTLFTDKILEDTTYDTTLREYIDTYLGLKNYTVLEQEFGIIPMTTVAFKQQTGNIIYIGTAGGATKTSSGYTFQFIQKQVQAIATSIIENKSLPAPIHSWRFRLYDAILLRVIESGRLSGEMIFKRMFATSSMQTILQFLDNETTIWKEINIFRRLQIKPFFMAAWYTLWGK